MKIITKEQAFEALDQQEYGVPFEAIEFLYQHPADEEILNKIQAAFEAIYNNTLTEKELEDSNTALWYAIVAENHLDISILDSIINLITQAYAGSSFLDEQVSLLIGLMGQKHGTVAVDKTLAAIESTLKNKSKRDKPFLFLFDILFYADITKHKEIIRRILQDPNNQYATPFAITICYAGFKAFLPELKKLVQIKSKTPTQHLFEADFLLSHLKSIIKQLEAGKFKDPKDALPFFEQRSDWKTYYQEQALHFEADVPEDVGTIKNIQKIGRNEPCPCGSGKKYKKCCLKNK